MFQNLKIAFRKQKRLVMIFLLTIFLPSVTLSIFGLIALGNERYRLERQYREQKLSLIDSIKSEVNRQIGNVEKELQHLVRTDAFLNRDFSGILKMVDIHLNQSPLTDQFFVIYYGYEPWFPPFQSTERDYTPAATEGLSDIQKMNLEQAENLEFAHQDYSGALLLLGELLDDAKEHDLQAQLLNLIARNHMKQGNLEQAIAVYSEIIREFPEATTSSGTPLPISARFQLIDCFLGLGLNENALEETLEAYHEITHHYPSLREDQLSAYASLAQDKFNFIRGEFPVLFDADSSYIINYEKLNSEYEQIDHRWKVINELKEECIPDIIGEVINPGNYSERTYRSSVKLADDDYLLLFCKIPDKNQTESSGFTGIKIDNDSLKGSLLTAILAHSSPNNVESLNVSDLDGNIIIGDATNTGDATPITSLFESNFPPWRLEISGDPTRPFMIRGIVRSYYFWTILVMMVILVFGVAIIGRMIAHEKEVLKLKSEFVSSVSHEFKTPITSIKALSERLLEGSVKEPARMREYYAVIAQDAENLSHLVGNVLDFSKMEEGKKEYSFEETYLHEWLEEILSGFFSKQPDRHYKFRSILGKTAVPVQMDRNALKLAVNNLLDNAVKFSSQQSEIAVILEQKQLHYRISIKDEGIGIPGDEQSRIFEKFYRGKHSSDYAATGTGLGLVIVKQVVDAHGGEIQVESEPGSGSIFKIILPFEQY